MCLAIYLPPGQSLTLEETRNAYDRNPHGCGFLHAKDDELLSFKTLGDADDFYGELIEAQATNPDSGFLVHFRVATHGLINIDNCHPFICENHVSKFGVIHNGIFRIPKLDMIQHCIDNPEIENPEDKSDTWWFSRLILEKMPEAFWESRMILSMLDIYISDSWSKLLLMLPSGSVFIFNQKAGLRDHNGRWFSNSSFQEPKFRKGKCCMCKRKKFINSNTFMCLECEKELDDQGAVETTI